MYSCPVTTPSAPSDPVLRHVSLPSGRVGYRDEGSGPCLVAAHGIPGSSRDFRWLAPALTRSLRLVRPDMPGFGGTELDVEPGPSVQARARFLLRFVDALGLERPVVLGHSMGGVVAAQAAALEPGRFAGLALISSPGLRPHRAFREVQRGRRLFPLLALRPVARLAGELLRPVYARAGFRGSYSALALSHTLRCVSAIDFEQHARNVTAAAPCLVSFCDDDPLIETDIFLELSEAAAKGPRLRFATGAHNPQKAWAEELGASLCEWTRSLAGASREDSAGRGVLAREG